MFGVVVVCVWSGDWYMLLAPILAFPKTFFSLLHLTPLAMIAVACFFCLKLMKWIHVCLLAVVPIFVSISSSVNVVLCAGRRCDLSKNGHCCAQIPTASWPFYKQLWWILLFVTVPNLDPGYFYPELKSLLHLGRFHVIVMKLGTNAIYWALI